MGNKKTLNKYTKQTIEIARLRKALRKIANFPVAIELWMEDGEKLLVYEEVVGMIKYMARKEAER